MDETMEARQTLAAVRQGSWNSAELSLAAGLTELPPEILDLEALEVLDLSGNRLKSLPAGFSRLKKLRILFLSGNEFEEVPEVLGECPKLEMVGFKSNRIAHIPPAALPEALRWLIVTDNRLRSLPDSVGLRPRLQKLITHHQAHVPRAQHQHPFARSQSMNIHHRLGGARTNDSGAR